MRPFKCKRCGAMLDLDQGVCPSCGAEYFVVPESELGAPPPPAGADFEPTRYWRQGALPGESPLDEILREAQEPGTGSIPSDRPVQPQRPVNSPQGNTSPPRQPGNPPQANPPQVWRPASPGQGNIPPQQRPANPQQGYVSSEGRYVPPSQRPVNPSAQGYYPPTQRPANPQQPGYPSQRPGNPQRPGYPTQRPANPQQPSYPPPQGYYPPPSQRQSVPPPPNYPPPPRPDSDYSDYDDEDSARRVRKRNIIIISAIAVLAVLILMIFLLSSPFGGKQNSSVMPDLVGKTEVFATSTLKDMGLTVNVEREASDQNQGTVIDQSIAKGKAVSKGEMVTITVSDGPEESPSPSPSPAATVSVPRFVNLDYSAASQLAASTGVQLIRDEDQYSDSIPSGRIISQTPAENTEVSRDSIVHVVLSKGPEPTPTPSPTPAGFGITVTAGTGGAVSPKGIVTVPEGQSLTFTITPNPGYEIRDVKVDGVSVMGALINSSYTFVNVTADHTLYAIFQAVPPSPSPTATPTPTPTPSPSPSPTPTPTPTPTPSPSPSA